jgi:hypothetical protein
VAHDPDVAGRQGGDGEQLAADAAVAGTGVGRLKTLVANLAIAGLSNREIAERAFLTVKTVEAILTRTYRKLGIRSRGGLARAPETTKPAGGQRARP